MFNKKRNAQYRQKINKITGISIILVLLIFLLTITTIIIIRSRTGNNIRNTPNNLNITSKELTRLWNAGEHEQVYTISKNALDIKPIDYFLLTINGFSAYQLGISQINNHNMLFFIDESIKSLRKALLLKEVLTDPRVYYVLGKAYYYKGNEYSDLTVKYLELADKSYDARDIPEYLGLAYAAGGDYRSSVEAFTRSFAYFTIEKPPPDNLLLSIARSYFAMEEYDMAADYLQRCINTSPDSKSIIVARFLLAEIYKISGDFDDAEKQYLSILNNYGENAEVHYQMGELYNLKGDTTRARAEWRMAFRQDPTHAKARERLNI
jgi:tetratricopeptide (TPR) repeat protein